MNTHPITIRCPLGKKVTTNLNGQEFDLFELAPVQDISWDDKCEVFLGSRLCEDPNHRLFFVYHEQRLFTPDVKTWADVADPEWEKWAEKYRSNRVGGVL